MKVLDTFLKIWFSIVALFTFFVIYLNASITKEFDGFLSIAGITILFSIPLAILLWIVLAISCKIGPDTMTFQKLLFIYVIATLSVMFFDNVFKMNEVSKPMYLSVSISITLWTRSILSMYSNFHTQPHTQPHTAFPSHTQPHSTFHL